MLLVSRKQQKTRKVVETVDDSLLSITEDSVEQYKYMDADLTEYSSSKPQQDSSLTDQKPPIEKSAEPETVSPEQSVEVADKVDLPEGLSSESSLVYNA